MLQHLQGTSPVLYSASGWLRASRESPTTRSAASLLQESCKADLSKLFVSCRGAAISSTLGGSMVCGGAGLGSESGGTLRRASSIRRTLNAGTAAIKRKSVALQVKFTVDGLVETLRRTRSKFVLCLLPQHNAGLCEARRERDSLSGSLLPSSPNGSTITTDESLLNIPLLRSQVSFRLVKS